MAVTLNANSSTGFIATSDTSGVLQLQTGGTTAVTVDASQNVGIGTSSPSKLLDVAGNAAITGTGVLSLQRPIVPTFGQGTPQLTFQYYTTGTTYTTGAQIQALADGSWSSTSAPTNMLFYTCPSASTTIAERMRIDSSGNVGIGVSTPAQKLQVNGKAIIGTYAGTGAYGLYLRSDAESTHYNWQISTQNAVNGAIEFARSTAVGGSTFNSPSVVIDTGGSLLVGATAAGISEKLNVTQSANAAGIFVNPTNASFSGTGIYVNTTRAANAGFDLYAGYANSVGQFRVTGAGVIYAINTTIQSISDQRLKENICDSSDGLTVINALRPVRFDWKEGYGNDQKNQLGFIAQEIETVFPEAVGEWQVNKDDETLYKTVGPAALIPVLVKAIQEQQALITQLQADVAALKGASA